jgi:glycosyltransferase involved in cell wall biosynthesis
VRVILLSERVSPPYDEGIKNVAVHLLQGMQSRGHITLALTTAGEDDAGLQLHNVPANRLLLSSALRKAVRGFQPDVIVYIPTACGTVYSLLRGQVLRAYHSRAQLALLLLQPRAHPAWAKPLVRCLRPNIVLAQSSKTVRPYCELGWRTGLLPPAVDADRFCPASLDQRAALRAQYGIPAGAKVVTHVGHLKGKRNLEEMLALRQSKGFHVLVAASTSTEQDATLRRQLEAHGATVVDEYVPRIEDIYRLSDAYVFLAQDETAAIDVPLSVLEAMACNLPVVCTPYGGLPDWFADGSGLAFWHGANGLADTVAAVMHSPVSTRCLVVERTWPEAAEELLKQVAVERSGR